MQTAGIQVRQTAQHGVETSHSFLNLSQDRDIPSFKVRERHGVRDCCVWLDDVTIGDVGSAEESKMRNDGIEKKYEIEKIRDCGFMFRLCCNANKCRK